MFSNLLFKGVLWVNLDVVSSWEYLPLFCAQFDFGLQGSKCICYVCSLDWRHCVGPRLFDKDIFV